PSRPHRDLPSFPTRRSSDLGREGATDADHEVAGWLRRLDRETLLVATKMDDERHLDTAEFFELYGLGFGEPFPTAAEHGVGTSEDRKSTRLNSSHVKISYAV